jgi:beta-phosphoglucomutase-like phosphatase (HAD superfamily)
MLKQIKGAMFDVDGLLLDTEIFQYDAWVAALAEIGGEITPEEYKRFAGQGRYDIAKVLIPEKQLDTTISDLVEAKLSHLYRIIEDSDCAPMPYAAETLDFFAEKVPVALVTGGKLDETDIKLRKSGFDPLVRGFPIIGKESVNTAKPHPGHYIRGAELLGLNPEDCIGFEDSEPGAISIRDSGAIAVAILNSRFTNKKAYGAAHHNYTSLKEAVADLSNRYIFQSR